MRIAEIHGGFTDKGLHGELVMMADGGRTGYYAVFNPVLQKTLAAHLGETASWVKTADTGGTPTLVDIGFFPDEIKEADEEVAKAIQKLAEAKKASRLNRLFNRILGRH